MKGGVVGHGIAGLSECVRLAEAGHDVFGFEQFAPLHDRGSSHGDTRIFRLTPGEGEIYVPLAERSRAGWLNWQKRFAAPLLEPRSGVMTGPPGSAFVQSCEDLSARYGHAFAVLNSADLARQTNGAMTLPANWPICLQQECGVLFADAARTFLANHARDLGARLQFDARVTSPIETTTLTINGETHTFDALIVTAGAWTPSLLPELASVLTPKRRVTAWFKPRTAANNLPIICADNEIGLYGMPTPDGLYKIGAHVIGEAVDPDHVAEPSADDAAMLSTQMAAFFPLHDSVPVRMKRCIYTMTADENFLIAPVREPVLALSCCSGHGFKYAPIYGDFALNWLEGRGTPAAFGLSARASAATKLGQG